MRTHIKITNFYRKSETSLILYILKNPTDATTCTKNI